jgi:hypothetical protein
MRDLWLFKHDISTAGPLPASNFARWTDAQPWLALDGSSIYLYAQGDKLADSVPPGAGGDWRRLTCLQELRGASAGETASHHYVVETDVLAEFEDDLNAWYAEEHLPGLAAVPGTVRAARYIDPTGSPRYYACYDLAGAETLGSPEWLAVRATRWSSRVRPAFRNTRRTVFGRVPGTR